MSPWAQIWWHWEATRNQWTKIGPTLWNGTMELVDMPGRSPLGSVSRLGTCYLKRVRGGLGSRFVTQPKGNSNFRLVTFFCMRGDPLRGKSDLLYLRYTRVCTDTQDDFFCYNAQLSYELRHQPKIWVFLPLGHKIGLLRSPWPILGWMSPF